MFPPLLLPLYLPQIEHPYIPTSDVHIFAVYHNKSGLINGVEPGTSIEIIVTDDLGERIIASAQTNHYPSVDLVLPYGIYNATTEYDGYTCDNDTAIVNSPKETFLIDCWEQ